MSNNNKFALSIIDFLQVSAANEHLAKNKQECLEVAAQCLADAFDLDKKDAPSGAGAKLKTAFEEFQAREAALTEAKKKEAEELKVKGNEAVANHEYETAIDYYTQALNIIPTSPVFLSNRASAYSHLGQHEKAIEDAEKAAQIEPTHVRAYSRLGYAKYSLGRLEEAIEAYKKGLSLDPNNAVLQKSLSLAEKKLEAKEESSSSAASTTTQDRAAPSGLPNLGGLGSGGMPDLASLMNNPAVMNMAQNMMQSGALNGLLNNPNIANMARNFQNGQMPNLQDLMNNPQLQQMARSFMGGMGGNSENSNNNSGNH
ncbi:SGT2 family TPR repeat protein [Schizosaccharomyces japonicus yFS275]|uniref:SGT2 family TPR repeat protein n=1 Tax=Schizosaccharomyces japonicus (strain yFS275 / FY16936) TaxID=402676 RepID=B6JY37_SCHJY|nr:SGT2 family TPR repeat protein [Schizosaccharomyces japonicus yFS275]EEB06455.1 SGT2 family TPR repeat protein [Schizosaccharomyces japonicus yFS275]